MPSVGPVAEQFFPASVLNATPGVGKAQILATAYTAKLLSSLIAICRERGGFASGERERLINRLHRVDADRNQHPSLYRFYFAFWDEAMGRPVNASVEALVDFLRSPPNAALAVKRLQRRGWPLKDVITPREAMVLEKSGRIRFDELDCAAFDAQRPLVETAISTVSALVPALGEEIKRLVSRIYLFSGRTVVGLTDPRFHGAMFLSAPRTPHGSIAYYIEHIVHETSHMYLNTLLAFDPIVRNGQDALFDAPIRADKRPLLGIFHATFVLFRIVHALRAYAQATKGVEHDAAARMTDESLCRFAKGMAVLEDHADLSPWGARLLHSMQSQPCA